jgi:hypothetical protein
MTLETLKEANQLNHRINELSTMEQIVENMLHSDNNLWISDHDSGEVLVSPEARLDIINTVLGDLREQRDELEDKLRML